MIPRWQAIGLPEEAEGRAEGGIEMLVGLVRKGRLSLGEAAEEANMSISDFAKKAGLKE